MKNKKGGRGGGERTGWVEIEIYGDIYQDRAKDTNHPPHNLQLRSFRLPRWKLSCSTAAVQPVGSLAHNFFKRFNHERADFKKFRWRRKVDLLLLPSDLHWVVDCPFSFLALVMP